MADTIVRILEILGPLIIDEVNLHIDSRMHFQILETNLKEIQRMLGDAERKHRNPAIQRWLEKLQDVAYDIEDFVEDTEAQKRLRHLEVKNQTANMSLWEKMSHCLLLPCSFGKNCFVDRSIAVDVKDLNERIKNILTEGRDPLKALVGGNSYEDEYKDLPTMSAAASKRFFGRKKDIVEVKKMLLAHVNMGDGKATNIPVISIVGVAGIGKTALASWIYADNYMNREYPLKMWVSASGKLNSSENIKIATHIFERLEGYSPGVTSLKALRTKIEESLQKKSTKFLLVLDNISVEDYVSWQPLESCLSHGAEGSRIIVTTRELITAEAMHSTRIHNLQPLKDRSCWKIVCRAALDCETYDPLEELGLQIANKCNGLPLAAEILGKCLRNKRNPKEWLRVLKSEIWDLDYGEKLFRPFLVSYDGLKPAERRCFSYFAVFPKGSRMEKEELWKIWDAQGFASSPVILQQIFGSLRNRSFFRNVEYIDGVLSFKLHDIVHDFARYIAGNQCVVVGLETSISHEYISSRVPRHLSYVHPDTGNQQSPVSFPEYIEFEKLRTFFCFTGLPAENVLGRLKRVRALVLAFCGLSEIPEEIEKFIHLRYLDLSGNDFRELPEFLCNLYHLQCLRLLQCLSLASLPQEISRLQKLRHLFLPVIENIRFTPGVASLTGLQTLNYVFAGKGCNYLGCLKNLRHLEGKLEVCMRGLDSDADVKEAKLATLESLTFVDSLSMDYDESVLLNVVEALTPYSKLQTLSIKTSGLMLPSWITSLRYLRKLSIFFMSEVEISTSLTGTHSFPPLWKLHYLKTLTLSFPPFSHDNWVHCFLRSIGLVHDPEESREFYELQSLSLGNSKCWKEWPDMIRGEEESASPRIALNLWELIIFDCPELEVLPLSLLKAGSDLQTLKIQNCPKLKERYMMSTGGYTDEISHIPEIYFS